MQMFFFTEAVQPVTTDMLTQELLHTFSYRCLHLECQLFPHCCHEAHDITSWQPQAWALRALKFNQLHNKNQKLKNWTLGFLFIMLIWYDAQIYQILLVYFYNGHSFNIDSKDIKNIFFFQEKRHKKKIKMIPLYPLCYVMLFFLVNGEICGIYGTCLYI